MATDATGRVMRRQRSYWLSMVSQRCFSDGETSVSFHFTVTQDERIMFMRNVRRTTSHEMCQILDGFRAECRVMICRLPKKEAQIMRFSALYDGYFCANAGNPTNRATRACVTYVGGFKCITWWPILENMFIPSKTDRNFIKANFMHQPLILDT